MDSAEQDSAGPDIVILRRWRGQYRSIIALFPEMREGPGTINSYEHVGQHGEANYQSVLDRTDPVRFDDPEAATLLDELRMIGYRPLLRQRRSWPRQRR
jgi:hypothetical protein